MSKPSLWKRLSYRDKKPIEVTFVTQQEIRDRRKANCLLLSLAVVLILTVSLCVIATHGKF